MHLKANGAAVLHGNIPNTILERNSHFYPVPSLCLDYKDLSFSCFSLHAAHNSLLWGSSDVKGWYGDLRYAIHVRR